MAQAGRRIDLMDVMDRVLDKGIVIDAGVWVSLIGIEVLAVHAQITVAAFETYLGFSEDPRAHERGLIGAAAPAASDATPPLAAYHDEELSTNRPEDPETSEQG